MDVSSAFGREYDRYGTLSGATLSTLALFNLIDNPALATEGEDFITMGSDKGPNDDLPHTLSQSSRTPLPFVQIPYSRAVRGTGSP